MPSKFVLRDFTEENTYHIYNKSVDGKPFFKDDKDYQTFIYYLTIYTLPLEKVLEKYPNLPFRLRYNNIAQDVDILSFLLLPNRFHILARLHTKEGISRLIKQITNAYTQHYNKKYQTSGPLVAGRFKSCQIEVEKDLINLTRFLDRQPQESIEQNFTTYPYSSYHEYASEKKDTITKQRLIRSFLNTPQSYKNFINDTEDYNASLPTLNKIIMHKAKKS